MYLLSEISRGYQAGHDIMIGFHINGLESAEPRHNKLALCWDLKFPHLGVDESSQLRIFRSDLCKTEIPSLETAR